MRTRMGWASAVAVLGLVATLAFAGAQGATAVQGQAVIAGQLNTETFETIVQNTNVTVENCSGVASYGLLGCGFRGLEGIGSHTGIFGDGGTYGLEGVGATGVFGAGASSGVEGNGFGSGNGVYGHANSTGTSGVYGENQGTGYGVAGRATGTGVFGDSADGIGVHASTQGGTALYSTAELGGTSIATQAPSSGLALRVIGKAEFKRSGKAVVQIGQSSVTISNVVLSAKSLVLATAQKNVAGVYVRAAVPNVANQTVTIYLNTSVGATYPVAWFIIERP